MCWLNKKLIMYLQGYVRPCNNSTKLSGTCIFVLLTYSSFHTKGHLLVCSSEISTLKSECISNGKNDFLYLDRFKIIFKIYFK